MINKSYLILIQNNVRKHLGNDYRVFIFGSRAGDENKEFSDIDIGILGKDKVNNTVITRIKEELDNSNIPYKTDVVDFQNVSPDFKNHALKKVIDL